MSERPVFDPRTLRDTLGRFCSGVVIVTATTGGETVGFVMQSFMSLSLDPPLIALAPAKTSTSWPKIRAAGRFCVNILSADQLDLCHRFATPCEDRFADVEYTSGVTGAPILSDVIAYIECDLHAEHEGGDHTIAIGRVVDLYTAKNAAPPLLFFRGKYGDFSET